jgi:hypothetical protein
MAAEMLLQKLDMNVTGEQDKIQNMVLEEEEDDDDEEEDAGN